MVKKKYSILTFIVFGLFFIFLFIISINADENTKVPSEVYNLASKNFNKIASAIVNDLSDNGYNYDLSKFTLGNAYKINYFRPDLLDIVSDNSAVKKISGLKDLITESDDYLYIINYDDKSFSYITVGKIEDNYEITSFGGEASYFNDCINLYKKNGDLKNLRVLAYGPREFYLVNGNFNSLQVSKDLSNTLIDGDILKDVILKSVAKKADRIKKGLPPERGSGSLLDLYNDYITTITIAN